MPHKMMTRARPRATTHRYALVVKAQRPLRLYGDEPGWASLLPESEAMGLDVGAGIKPGSTQNIWGVD